MRLVKKIPTHNGVNVVAPVGPSDFRSGTSPFEINVKFYNYLRVPVTIVTRVGLKTVLPSINSFTENRLIVRMCITVSHATANYIKKQLAAVDENSTLELQNLKKAASFQHEHNLHNGLELYIDHTLLIEDLINVGNSIYHNELDLVISLESYDGVPLHPNSVEGRKETTLSKLDEYSGFIYAIDIIDNLGTYGSRFFNIGDNVYKINTVKDDGRMDGFYIMGAIPINGDINIKDRKMEYLPFGEESDKRLGLYRTFEEAKNHLVDVKTERTLELEELIKENILTKLEVENIRQNAELLKVTNVKELEAIEIERQDYKFKLDKMREDRVLELEKIRGEQIRDREKALHEQKLELEKMKSMHDERSFERKDQNEGLKMLPAIAVGIGSLILAFKAFG